MCREPEEAMTHPVLEPGTYDYVKNPMVAVIRACQPDQARRVSVETTVF